MTFYRSDHLLSAFSEIQHKISFLETEYKVQSFFVAVDINGTQHTFASTYGKWFLKINEGLTNEFVHSCGSSCFSREAKSLTGVNADSSEFGSYVALLEDSDACNTDKEIHLMVNFSGSTNVNGDEFSGSPAESKEFAYESCDYFQSSSDQYDYVQLPEPDKLTRCDKADQSVHQDYNKNPETCFYCGVLVFSKYELKQHISSEHQDKRPHQCLKCLSSFENESELVQHQKIHLCHRLYQCTRCSKNFQSLNAVKKHDCTSCQSNFRNTKTNINSKKEEEGEDFLTNKVLLCRWCGETFQNDSEYHGHIANHLKLGFKCSKCEAHFKTWKTLKDHLALVHADPVPFRCSHCSAAFKTALLLHRHFERSHCAFEEESTNSPSQKRIKKSALKGDGPREVHLCSCCGKCFGSDKELDRHESRAHQENNNNVCSYCDKKFKSQSCLDQHLSSIHSDSNVKSEKSSDESTPLTCAHCRQDFNKPKDLRTHLHMSNCLDTSAQPTEANCKVERIQEMSETISGQFLDLLGQKDTSEPPRNEKTNNLRFENNLLTSKTKVSPWHSSKKQQSGSCNLCHICGKNFALPHYLYQHMICHKEKRPFKCQHCGKRFKRRSILREHSALHSDLKKFRCKLCHRDFHFASVLRQHMAVHSSERPHSCTVCKRSFKHLAGLRKHRCSKTSDTCSQSDDLSVAFHERNQLHKDESVPAIEIAPGEQPKRVQEEQDPSRPFACELCSKRFTLQKALKKHSRVHSEERPFACNECGKRFKHPSSLKQHQAVHSNERPFKCTCCSKCFKNSTSLKEHMDKNKYKCTGCGREYMHKKSLKVHMPTCPNLSQQMEELQQRSQTDLQLTHNEEDIELAQGSYLQKDNCSDSVAATSMSDPCQQISSKSDTYIICQQQQQQFRTFSLPSSILIPTEAYQVPHNQQQLCLTTAGNILKIDELATNQQLLQLPQPEQQQWLITQSQLSNLQLQFIQQQFI